MKEKIKQVKREQFLGVIPVYTYILYIFVSSLLCCSHALLENSI